MVSMYYLEHLGPCWICFLQTKEERVQTRLPQKKLLDHNNICLQEEHGKDEFLQAIQVLAPRFSTHLHIFLDNEHAEGSGFCTHWDLLLEDALVTHVVTCQGRDHLVSIRSG